MKTTKILLPLIASLVLYSGATYSKTPKCKPLPTYGQGYYGKADKHAKAGAVMIQLLDMQGNACGYYGTKTLNYKYFAFTRGGQ